MYVMLIAQGIIPLVVLIVLNAKIYTAIRYAHSHSPQHYHKKICFFGFEG